jgi:hypothetical protein
MAISLINTTGNGRISFINNPNTAPGNIDMKVSVPAAGIYTYLPDLFLDWPANTNYFTRYASAWAGYDDGYNSTGVIMPTDFYMDGSVANTIFVSTNGYITIGQGYADITSYPNDLPALKMLAGNPGDNWLYANGVTNTDGDVHNWYYRFINQEDGENMYRMQNIIYCGAYANPQLPLSYMMNLYRDIAYQWMETRIKFNPAGGAPQSGPYNASNVAQSASTVSNVWRSNLYGQNWVYMGNGSVGIL